MGSLRGLLAELDETAIATNVAIPHDEARMRYSLMRNTVQDYNEFVDVISTYYNYHLSECVIHGGSVSRTEAAGRAKDSLQQEYRRIGGDINTAYNDAHDGTNGGLRIVLDKLADRLKTESVERYIRDAFDRHVEPVSWEQKVEIMSQVLMQFGHLFPSSVRTNQPERYASNYEELIRALVDALKKVSSDYKRF
ncbi:MAG: hypothetical protein CVU57_23570 [Deltaproteobacteria bacterium HGW-Deltaproteobacteria-15]|jgi:hypothetical protein|nr:MAG: hypothetical protein CVU57_23570 [Deltaproteobacteria bacterium HGW-Deltaproteobacteria-15]